MLQNIRDNSQGFVAKIIIGLIIAVMALFGVESIVGGLGGNTVAEVNGEEISEQELMQTTQRLMASIGGDIANLEPGLLQQIALNQIIEDRLLLQAATDAGMNIDSDSIDRQIINNPNFQVGGRFDNDLAVRTMASQGYTPQTYREFLKQNMLMGQLSNSYAASEFITTAELERAAGLAGQTRDFRYVSITLGDRAGEVNISADEIEQYYQNNQQQFMHEEQVRVAYVMLDKNDLFADFDIDEEAIRAQYEEERRNAEETTERRVSHILVEGEGDDALARAEAAKARLEAGEDFAELALEISDDTESAQNGGDIGYTDGSTFPAPMEAAIAELEVDEVSEPVVTEFGVHLVKLTEYNVTDFPDFEEVRDRIAQDLSSAEVDQLYSSRLEELSNIAFETQGLEEAADWLEIEIQQSEAFGRSGGSGIAANQQVVQAAFSDEVLLEGNNSDVIELDDSRAVVLNVAEHTEASVRPLEDVRAEIRVMLRTEIETERAQALGADILASLRETGSAEEILAENNLQWQEETQASRNQPTVNGQLLNEVFSLPVPDQEPVYEGVALDNGTYVVVELRQVSPGTLADMTDAERQELKQSLMQSRGRAAFDAYLANLREQADITENLDAATFEGF